MDDKSAKRKPNRNRTHNVSIRMNDAEYEELRRKMEESGQSMQSLIINSIYGSTVATPDVLKELQNLGRQFGETSRQFRGICTNINQQTHDLNLLCSIMQEAQPDIGKARQLQGSIPTSEELKATAEICAVYREEVEKIWQSLRQLMARQKPTAH